MKDRSIDSVKRALLGVKATDVRALLLDAAQVLQYKWAPQTSAVTSRGFPVRLCIKEALRECSALQGQRAWYPAYLLIALCIESGTVSDWEQDPYRNSDDVLELMKSARELLNVVDTKQREFKL